MTWDPADTQIIDTGVGIGGGGGGGGTGARAPLTFGHRGQGRPNVEGCVRLQQLYVSIPEGKTTLEISYR